MLPTSGPFQSSSNRNILSKRNWNLNPSQKELLLWHQRLGHADFSRVQAMLSKPRTSLRDEHRRQMITPRHIGSSSCDLTLLKCEACQLAKQKARHPCSKISSSINELEGSLSQNILKPGQRISCDQYMSSTLGRQAHTFGKEHANKRLVGGTIFVDHATNFIFHNHQINLTATETV